MNACPTLRPATPVETLYLRKSDAPMYVCYDNDEKDPIVFVLECNGGNNYALRVASEKKLHFVTLKEYVGNAADVLKEANKRIAIFFGH